MDAKSCRSIRLCKSACKGARTAYSRAQMLSILERELRVASRRRWTFWSRVVTSVVAFASGFFLVLVASFQMVNGQYLFNALVFVSFWICLIQGVRRAAASISDEKRDRSEEHTSELQ